MYQYEVITDLSTEPVTLQEAKDFMQIDYSDFDDLITFLIEASRKASENVTGKAYGAKLIQVTGNDIVGRSGDIEKVYPVTPFVSDETWSEEDGNIDYRYNAGFTVIPDALKKAILARVATDFVFRQGKEDTNLNPVWSAYIANERQYITALCL